jgi:hypothetical protein
MICVILGKKIDSIKRKEGITTIQAIVKIEVLKKEMGASWRGMGQTSRGLQMLCAFFFFTRLSTRRSSSPDCQSSTFKLIPSQTKHDWNTGLKKCTH